MNKVKLLIWSKDRACQLHLLLESIEKNLPNLFDISVLYTHSNGQFKNAYQILQGCFTDADFVLETDFQQDTLSIIDGADTNCIAMSTDDTVIYRRPEVGPFVYLTAGEVFSYRLGFNTIVQNPWDGMLQPELTNVEYCSHKIGWNALLYDPIMNYGYPFGLDMHQWNRLYFLNLIKRFEFHNTSELEGNLFRYRTECPYMFSFERSVAVNIPFNKLSDTVYTGEKVFYSTEELNDRYLSGQTIDLETIEKTDIVGCHQVINLEFRNG